MVLAGFRWHKGAEGEALGSASTTCRGPRFRHTAHFVRWRPDRPPGECTYAQLEATPTYELARIFAARA